MTNRIGMIALCVGLFVCGLFAGFWMVKFNQVKVAPQAMAGRKIVFVVQPYEKANLLVEPNDTIEWKHAGGADNHLIIHFPSEDAPCIGWTPGNQPSNHKCQIDPAKSHGVYFFTCEDANHQTFDCPDPGIQPRGTTLSQGPTNPNTSTTVLAAVACNNSTSTVEVTPSGGKAGNAIKALPGQTIYWDSPYDFQIGFNGTSPCSNTLPSAPGQGPLFCAVLPNASKTYSYTATANGCSNPLPNGQIQVGP